MKLFVLKNETLSTFETSSSAENLNNFLIIFLHAFTFFASILPPFQIPCSFCLSSFPLLAFQYITHFYHEYAKQLCYDNCEQIYTNYSKKYVSERADTIKSTAHLDFYILNIACKTTLLIVKFMGKYAV